MKKLITALLLFTSIVSVYAIPASELEYQEVLRAKIEIALKWCKRTDTCSQRRDQITADLREYIEGMEADIAFCQKYAAYPDTSDDERRETAKAVEEYQQKLHWAEREIQWLSKQDVK